jgi:hypothetical protein
LNTSFSATPGELADGRRIFVITALRSTHGQVNIGNVVTPMTHW